MDLVPVPIGEAQPRGSFEQDQCHRLTMHHSKTPPIYQGGVSLFILRVGKKVVLLILLPIFLSFPIVFGEGGRGGGVRDYQCPHLYISHKFTKL